MSQKIEYKSGAHTGMEWIKKNIPVAFSLNFESYFNIKKKFISVAQLDQFAAAPAPH
jgi:hypothetical protein